MKPVVYDDRLSGLRLSDKNSNMATSVPGMNEVDRDSSERISPSRRTLKSGGRGVNDSTQYQIAGMVESNVEFTTTTPWNDSSVVAGTSTKKPITPTNAVNERSQVAPPLSKSKSKGPKYPPMAPSEAESSFIKEGDSRLMSNSK